jgi:P27 family predicted phage terminase small subunit
MPAHRKPHDRRQGHRDHSPLTLVGPSTAPDIVPDPPAGLLKATQQAWAEFWASPLASLAIGADRVALERLFELLDDRSRCWREYKRARLVLGSQGQPVLNPLARQVATLDAEIRALQDRFGLTPASRLRLGIALGEAARSLEDLNATMAAEMANEDSDRDDPRFDHPRRDPVDLAGGDG